MNLKQVGEQHAQQAGDQDTQKGSGHRRSASAVKTVNQRNDHHAQNQREGDADPDRVVALEEKGHQHFPDRQDC